MRSRSVVVLVVAVSTLWAADKVQSFNVKPGLWEVTTTTNTSGQLPIPAALLEKLTPEQRARVEERMNARSSQPAKANTYKHCLTQEELDKGTSFGQSEKACAPTIVSSTSSKIDLRLECAENGVKWEAKAHFEAIDSEKVTGRIESSATGGDHTMNSDSTFTAKWIGPVCSTTK